MRMRSVRGIGGQVRVRRGGLEISQVLGDLVNVFEVSRTGQKGWLPLVPALAHTRSFALYENSVGCTSVGAAPPIGAPIGGNAGALGPPTTSTRLVGTSSEVNADAPPSTNSGEGGGSS